MIDDVPAVVKIQRQRQEFIHKKLIEQVEDDDEDRNNSTSQRKETIHNDFIDSSWWEWLSRSEKIGERIEDIDDNHLLPDIPVSEFPRGDNIAVALNRLQRPPQLNSSPYSTKTKKSSRQNHSLRPNLQNPMHIKKELQRL